MARLIKTEQLLVGAGFTIVHKFNARWFEVKTPEGEAGYVLCQSFAAWHFFYKDCVHTASSYTVERCHMGGLGDALNTDSQIDTYMRLMQPGDIPRVIRHCDSVFAAMSQVYNETH